MTEHQPLPVTGYTPQSDDNVQLVNEGKALERQLLDYIERLNGLGQTDKRMLAIARTEVQTGMMWAYRAVFQPQS